MINNSQTILSMLNPSGEIIIGIFKDPSNQLDVWIDDENINTIEISNELSNLDSFNLITVRGNTTIPSIGVKSPDNNSIYMGCGCTG